MSGPTSGDAEPRRSFLKESAALVTGGLAAAVPAAAGLFVWLDPLRRHTGAAATFTKVTTLDALPADGVPRLFKIRTERVDAWTRLPQETVGAVFVRRTGPAAVEVLSPICPHMGCFVEFQSAPKDFFCPCHNSRFALDGKIAQAKSPSPRPLDTLPVEIRGQEVWVKYERFHTGIPEKKLMG